MAGALLVSGIMRALEREDYANEGDEERARNASKMEEIAIELLEEYTELGEEQAFHALMHEVPALGQRNCLDLARSSDSISFAAQSGFASLVDKLWYGGIVGPYNRFFLICCCMPLILFPFLRSSLELVNLKEYFFKIVCE